MAKVKVVKPYVFYYGGRIRQVGEIIEVSDKVADVLAKRGIAQIIAVEPEEKMQKRVKRKKRKG